MRAKKPLFIAVLTVAYVLGILWLVDFKDVVDLLSRIPLASIVWVSVFAILANLFALARSRSALKAFHFTAGWKDIYIAFAAGNLATLAFNVFGQSLSRAVILQSAGIPFGISVIATYVERLLAAGILFAISLAAAWILFSSIEINLYRGIGDLVVSMIGIAAASVAVGVIALRKFAAEGSLAGLRLITRLGPSALWTLLGLGAGLAAYLELFHALDPASISLKLVAALTIVMLATSLPISFAGFGLRELSAATVLTLVGVSPTTAVASSVLIGIIYIVVAGLIGLTALPLASKEQPKLRENKPDSIERRPFVTDALIIQCFAIACAVLIFFRVRAPVSDREVLININVADVVVFMALTVIALMILVGRLRNLFPPAIFRSALVLTAALSIGMIGAFSYGHLGGWAIYTRGWGWIVILGYLALGAATVRLAGEAGREIVANCLMVSTVTICALQLGAALVNSLYPLPYYVVSIPLQGFAHNQNAFAFDLAISGVLLIAAKHAGPLRDRQLVFLLSMAAVSAAMFLTESRTGVVFVVVLAGLDLAFSLFRKSTRGDMFSPIATIAIVAAFTILTFSVPVSSNTASQAPVQTHNLPQVASADVETTRLNHPHADRERWDTIVGGLQSWSASPIFGVGIGSYFEASRLTGRPKSIHSIYVWFLSEMGVVGLMALLISAGLLTHLAWQKLNEPDGRWGFTAFSSLTFMGIGGLVQDFSYQRIFWFILGLSLATPGSMTKAHNVDRIFVSAVAAFAALLLILWHWPR